MMDIRDWQVALVVGVVFGLTAPIVSFIADQPVGGGILAIFAFLCWALAAIWRAFP